MTYLNKFKIAALCLFAVIIVNIIFAAAKEQELNTVSHAYVDQYMGQWYEIAKIPHWFEKGLVGTSVTYSLLPGGEVDVLIKAYKKGFNGKSYYSKFTASIGNKKTYAEIIVKVFWFFTGTFYILDLGENYEYAVVGNKARDKVWILSRTPRMDPGLYDTLLKRIQMNGFNTSKIEKTRQENKR